MIGTIFSKSLVIEKEGGNMENIRRSLFGYDKKEVEAFVRSLEKENEKLKKELVEKTETTDQLRAQVQKFRSKEELISESIIDAKQLSKQLVEEAKQQATEMIDAANKIISDEFERFNQTMDTLNEMKNKVVAQKTELSKELQELLLRYKNAFENSETEDFTRIKEHFEEEISQSEKVFESSKQVIYIPDVIQNHH